MMSVIKKASVILIVNEESKSNRYHGAMRCENLEMSLFNLGLNYGTYYGKGRNGSIMLNPMAFTLLWEIPQEYRLTWSTVMLSVSEMSIESVSNLSERFFPNGQNDGFLCNEADNNLLTSINPNWL